MSIYVAGRLGIASGTAQKWNLLLKPYLVNAIICGFVHSTEEIFKVKFFVQYEIAIWAVNPFVSNK